MANHFRDDSPDAFRASLIMFLSDHLSIRSKSRLLVLKCCMPFSLVSCNGSRLSSKFPFFLSFLKNVASAEPGLLSDLDLFDCQGVFYVTLAKNRRSVLLCNSIQAGRLTTAPRIADLTGFCVHSAVILLRKIWETHSHTMSSDCLAPRKHLSNYLSN